MPYRTAIGTVFDSGNFTPILQDALAASGYQDFAKRRKAAQRAGKLRVSAVGKLRVSAVG